MRDSSVYDVSAVYASSDSVKASADLRDHASGDYSAVDAVLNGGSESGFREEKLDKRNACGVKDLTAYNAVQQIRTNGGATIALR